MGGSSSKTKKARPTNKHELSQTVDGEPSATTPDTNMKSKNSLKKKKTKKNSVKIKTDSKNTKKSKSCKDEESQNVDPALFADISEVGGDSPALSSPVYRKKSSCPSCEAKDILLGKNRSRSGSEKSLRFSDFNKVLRKTRIYDWEMEPLDIPLYGVPEPQSEDVCYICGVYTGCHVRTCRVCCRVYHDGCLSKIGHALNEKCRRLTTANMWSCHQCVSLNHLLTQEEVRTMLEDLEDLEICKDAIHQSNYLNYCKYSLQKQNKIFTSEKQQNSIQRFSQIAQGDPPTITWIQFLNLESVRILNQRCKDSLVRLLTKAELAEARKAFQKLDPVKMGVTTKAAVQALLDTDKSRASAYYPDDTMMYIDDDLDSPVTWSDFLRDRAIYFLGRRPNMTSADGAGTGNDDSKDGGITLSSLDSLDDDDDYNTCHSDIDTGVPIGNRESQKAKSTAAGVCLDDSAEGQLSSLHTSTTMLDEFNTEMEKCCCRHELRGANGESCQNTSCGQNRESENPPLTARISSSTTSAQNKGQIDKGPTSARCNAISHKESKAEDKNSRERVRGSPSSTPERNRSSPYNDSRHTPIPWEDLGNRPIQREQDEPKDLSHQMKRRSEVIPRRPAPSTSGQARAVSQIGCRHGKGVLAPAYGNLVGRVNTGEWGC